MEKLLKITPGCGVYLPSGEGDGYEWQAVSGISLDEEIITASGARYKLDAVRGIVPNFDPDTAADWDWLVSSRISQFTERLQTTLDALYTEMSGQISFLTEVTILAPKQIHMQGLAPDWIREVAGGVEHYWSMTGEAIP